MPKDAHVVHRDGGWERVSVQSGCGAEHVTCRVQNVSDETVDCQGLVFPWGAVAVLRIVAVPLQSSLEVVFDGYAEVQLLTPVIVAMGERNFAPISLCDGNTLTVGTEHWEGEEIQLQGELVMLK